MAWCPKCENEYKEGITVCADCGSELVDSLEEMYVPIYFGLEDDVTHVITCLEHVGRDIEFVKKYDDAEQIFEIAVKNKDSEEAKHMVRVYLTEIEAKRHAEEDAEETIIPKKYGNEVYEDTGKRAQEYKSGAYTLLLVGGLGLIALLLLNLNIIPLSLPRFSRILVTGVMGCLFIIFAFLGAASLKTCKKLVLQADKEDQKEKEILDWFANNITKDMIEESINPDETEEVLYFKRTENMRAFLKENYPDEADNFVEYLIEELYGKIFE